MKFKPFLLLLIFSAISIAVTAALFSVTGIASLFAGHFVTVALMASVLELGKVITASFLYRNWNNISKIFKYYLILMMLVLMLITSAGIFGYLSEAYQTTKGDYTLIENKISVLESKREIFVNRKNRLNDDKVSEIKTKESNRFRADSLTARGQSITRTRQDIKDSEQKITELENYIRSTEDSIGYYDSKIIDQKSFNIKGDLGPLSYIANIFNTNMDNIVKIFIFLLIFVFDPLAVSLIVAANISFKNYTNMQTEFTEIFSKNKSSIKITPEEKEKMKSVMENIERHHSNDNTHESSENIPGDTQSEKTNELEHKTKQINKNGPSWHSANWRP